MNTPDLDAIRRRGRTGDGTLTVDELQGLLLQVSFALMMVFMMAYFLFRADARRKQDEQLLEVERQKLVLAADAVDAERRARYGLDVLAPAEGPPPARALLSGDRLTSDPLVCGAFLKAARNGGADFADPLALRRDWIRAVCEKAQLDEDALARPSADWLGDEADAALGRYEDAIRRAEYQAAAELQRHWLAHPSAIGDPRVADILSRLDAVGEEGRLLLVTELSAALKGHALARLSKLASAEMLK